MSKKYKYLEKTRTYSYSRDKDEKYHNKILDIVNSKSLEDLKKDKIFQHHSLHIAIERYEIYTDSLALKKEIATDN